VTQNAHLKWVQQNRSISARTERVGPLVRRYLQQRYRPCREEAVRVASILADVVDEEFRKHCVIGAVEHGVALVHVDHPALVYAMRARWLDRLLQVLGGRGRYPSVRGIAFRFGKDGERIGSTRTGQVSVW
jgi:hypothetical protein